MSGPQVDLGEVFGLRRDELTKDDFEGVILDSGLKEQRRQTRRGGLGDAGLF